MITLWPFEIPLILLIQNLGAWLEIPMRVFTFMGQEEFFLLIMSALYWCIDPSLGARVGISLLLSTNINSYVKLLFHGARPYWFSEIIKPLSHETSFGFTSNHAQTATTVWGRMAWHIRNKWQKWILIAVIFLIGFSRLYLGVHFISDVVGGWLIGGIILLLIIKFEEPIIRYWKGKTLSMQILFSLLLSMISIAIGYMIIGLIGPWEIPVNWVANALRADSFHPINPLDQSGFFTMAGLLFGMMAGLSLLYNQGGYRVAKEPSKKLLCYVIGIFGVLLFWYGLGMIFPKTEDILGYLLRFIRYSLVSSWIAAFSPLLFIRLKIGEKLI